eukprot:1042425-Amphidinium_carterae.1
MGLGLSTRNCAVWPNRLGSAFLGLLGTPAANALSMISPAPSLAIARACISVCHWKLPLQYLKYD